jgi:hypothetical protein
VCELRGALRRIHLHLANREQGARREGLTGRTPSDEQHLGRMVHRITFLAVAIIHRAVLMRIEIMGCQLMSLFSLLSSGRV